MSESNEKTNPFRTWGSDDLVIASEKLYKYFRDQEFLLRTFKQTPEMAETISKNKKLQTNMYEIMQFFIKLKDQTK